MGQVSPSEEKFGANRDPFATLGGMALNPLVLGDNFVHRGLKRVRNL